MSARHRMLPASWRCPPRALIASAVLSLGTLAGCRQIVGIEPREVFDSGASPVSMACGLAVGSAECAACMTELCCDPAEKCLDDPECFAHEGCVVRQGCQLGDAACRIWCTNTWESENAIEQRLSNCRQAVCADACLGQPWGCLGHVAWQTPANSAMTTIKMSARATCSTCGSNGSSGPNGGVRVRACSLSDPKCDAPLGEGTTGPDGSVTVPVPTTINNFQLPKLAIYLELHKDGWLDTVLQLDTPPVSYDLDVGSVNMDRAADIEAAAAALGVSYDPARAVAKITVRDCLLAPTGDVELNWIAADDATKVQTYVTPSPWTAVAVNLPVTLVEAGVTDSGATPALSSVPVYQTSSTQYVARANLVVRPGAVTLDPFLVPTP